LIKLIAYRNERAFDMGDPLKMRSESFDRFHYQPYDDDDNGDYNRKPQEHKY
jgi:hypothetical protein